MTCVKSEPRPSVGRLCKSLEFVMCQVAIPHSLVHPIIMQENLQDSGRAGTFRPDCGTPQCVIAGRIEVLGILDFRNQLSELLIATKITQG